MKMKWNEDAKKRFEAGCSDVAIYPGTAKKDIVGAPWDGNTGVSVNPDGGDANDFYANNIKWMTLRGDENVKGAIKAFMYPEELNRCTGYKKIHEKMAAYVGQQIKEPCSIAWKTKVGNTDKGTDFSEKLHIIFNVSFGPVQKDHQTLNKDPNLNELSWDYTTTPIEVGVIEGEKYKPTAIFEIERDENTAAVYDAICDYIYGTDPKDGTSGQGTEGKLLLPADLIKMVVDAAKALS